MKQFSFLLCVLIAISFSTAAQPAQLKSGKELFTFFCGTWSGKGQFANGRSIEADVTFQPTLDSSWLLYQHTDRKPNVYQATSMWGIDKTTGKFVAYIFDNFQGHRLFYGDGWKEGKLVLTYSDTTGKKHYEQFIYEKLNADQFRMIYQVSTDSLIWKEGDHLTFSRNK